ncbi:General transcription factor 2-related zinc finger protein [Abeliophyllum distichum]|uniref:General transcription factor 2-related zinc finger protein n=1 Tax=Abeliophyllum distichum TaxID=126358 RepID=A0ABD1THQ9_9LAMI
MNVIDAIDEMDVQCVVNEGDETNEINKGNGNEMDGNDVQGGGDSFVCNGFSNWKNKVRLQRHIGKLGTAHNQARIKYECFKNQEKDNSFSAFDKNKFIRSCKYYPRDFSAVDILAIEEQLETYVIDMRSDNDFRGLRGLGDIAQKLVLTKKSEVYQLLYIL